MFLFLKVNPSVFLCSVAAPTFLIYILVKLQLSIEDKIEPILSRESCEPEGFQMPSIFKIGPAPSFATLFWRLCKQKWFFLNFLAYRAELLKALLHHFVGLCRYNGCYRILNMKDKKQRLKNHVRGKQWQNVRQWVMWGDRNLKWFALTKTRIGALWVIMWIRIRH